MSMGRAWVATSLALATGGCVIGPKDGALVTSRSATVPFTAAYYQPNKSAVVEQLNEQNGVWEQRAATTTPASPSNDPAGNPWYLWSADVALQSDARYWHWAPDRSLTLMTSLRVRSPSDGVTYRTFNTSPATDACVNRSKPFNGVTAYAECSTGNEVGLRFEDTVHGDAACAYGSKGCNTCVNNVQAAFRGLPGQSSKIRYKSRGDSQLPPFNANLAAFAGNTSHVQTIARIPGVEQDLIGTGRGPWFVLSRARPDKPGGAGLFLVRLGDMPTNGGRAIRQAATGEPPEGRQTVYYYPTSDVDHPGGLQMIGQYGAIAVDCDDDGQCGSATYIDFYDFSAPGSRNAFLQRFRVGVQGEPGKTQTITSVALSKLQSGHYLMFVYGKDTAHEGWFYVSDQTDITATTRWLYRGSWALPLPPNASDRVFPPSTPNNQYPNLTVGDVFKSLHEYQNTSMVTECGTGDIYMFGTSNSGFTIGQVIFGADVPGENHLSLFKLTRAASGQVAMDPVAVRSIDPGPDEYCTFRAGATMHATPDHTLAMYCSARKANTDFFGRPDSKLKMQEFAQ